MSAIFYLLARFETKEEARKGEVRASAFFDELHRFDLDYVDEKHEELMRKYPLVAKLAELLKVKNGSITMLDIEDFELYHDGTDVLVISELNRNSSWNDMAKLFYMLGARQVLWTSDEYVDVFRYLDMLAEKGYDTFASKPRMLSEEKLKREIDPLIVKKKLCEC